MPSSLTKASIVRVVHRAALFGNDTEDPFAFLQFVFGDFVVGIDGIVPLVRITTKRYFVSWGECLGIEAVYEGSYELLEVFTTGIDTIDGKVYTYIEFSYNKTAKLAAKMRGIVDQGISGNGKALTRPDHIMAYLIQFYGNELFDVVDKSTWYGLIKACVTQGLYISGIINRDNSFAEWFAEMLEYLFFTEIETGRITFHSETGGRSRFPVAHINANNELTTLSATATLKNISNLITVQYNLNWSTKRYDTQSEDLADQDSVNSYGEKLFNIPWKWGRSESLSIDIASRFLKRLKDPQFIIEGETYRHYLSNLRYGDLVTITSDELPHLSGFPFKNAFCSVRYAQLSTSQSKVKYKLFFENSFVRRYRKLGQRIFISTITGVTSLTEIVLDNVTGLTENFYIYVSSEFGVGYGIVLRVEGDTVFMKQAFDTTPKVGEKAYCSTSPDLVFLGRRNYQLGGEIEETVIIQY
ncbi:MAG: hypothetical protein HQM11_07620 [SAR324 cluster bacterium]|nr:hypothetical protein [SAR324 cluster bacterium]